MFSPEQAAADLAKERGLSLETQNHYCEQFRHYFAACHELKRNPLPADIRTVAKVYYECSRKGLDLQGLRNAIKLLHWLYGEIDPTRHPYVRTTLRELDGDMHNRLRAAARRPRRADRPAGSAKARP